MPNIEAVCDFGRRIADQLLPGDVVSLSGPLGAGKTTLARAIIEGLGHIGEVPSPTFTLIEVYSSEQMRVPLIHADFYRLNDPSEIIELGLEDYRDDHVLIAEWPEKAGGFAHDPRCLSITLEIAEEGRKAVVEAGSDWQGRLP